MPLLESLAGASARGYGFSIPNASSVYGPTPLIWTQLASNQTNIDIQNIPQTYDNLRVVLVARNTASNYYTGHGMQINNTNSTIYTRYAFGNDEQGSEGTYWTGNYGQIQDEYHYSRGQNTNSNYYGTNILDFYNYTNTSQTKTYLSTYHDADNANPAGWFNAGFTQINSGDWASTAAINRLTFYGNFQAGTTIAVLGYKKGVGL
jgi:hypothetical protein